MPSETPRSCPGGDETGAYGANVKGAVRQPLFRYPAFQQPDGVHLNVVLLGPVLGLCAMAGWTARDRAELGKEGRDVSKYRGEENEYLNNSQQKYWGEKKFGIWFVGGHFC